MHGDPIQGVDPTGKFLGAAGSIVFTHNLQLLSQGLVTITGLNLGLAPSLELRDFSLGLLANGELDAGFLLHDIAAGLVRAVTGAIGAVNDAIELHAFGIGAIQLTRAIGGLAKISNFSQIGKAVKSFFGRGGQSATALNQGIGRLGGRIADPSYVELVESMLENISQTQNGHFLNVKLVKVARGTLQHPDGRPARAIYEARFNNQLTHNGTIKIAEDATYYEILHELEHLKDHQKLGPKYFQLSEHTREVNVYEALQKSPYWNSFTDAEKLDALRQTQRWSNP